MSAPTILTELRASGVRFAVTAQDRLRVEAPLGVILPEVRTALIQHRAEIVRLLSPPCPFCKERGMRTDQIEREGLCYFDTSCLHCGEVVEIFIPPRQNQQILKVR